MNARLKRNETPLFFSLASLSRSLSRSLVGAQVPRPIALLSAITIIMGKRETRGPERDWERCAFRPSTERPIRISYVSIGEQPERTTVARREKNGRRVGKIVGTAGDAPEVPEVRPARANRATARPI